MKPAIAIYLQYYLTPSMTFIYRQLKAAENFFEPHVICSDVLSNLDRFPFKSIHNKRRNFIDLKKTRLFSKLYGWGKLLSIKPKLSIQQNNIFRNILVKKNIKLIHAHFGPAGLEIFNIAKSLSIPLMVTFHGYDASSLIKMDNYIKNLKKVFEYSSIIAVSNIMKEKLVAVGAKKESISVVRCGIPVEIFNFVERESVKNKFNDGKLITFLQVSNFVEKKGHKYTLLAYKNFLNHYSNSKLILGGDGLLRKNMQHFCVELGIEKNVKFMGLVDEKSVRQLMINSDVFLHHSVTSKIGDQEGIPTVIMEAMATGLPVISTNHSGIPELIKNNHDGFLVNEKDIKSYTDRLLNLHNLPDDFGIKARNKIEEDFNLKIETEKLFVLYNQHLK
jgi:glycosyltransferase involved in cell wall biosynthesis